MNDFRLLFSNHIYVEYSETVSLSGFPRWERINHNELTRRYGMLQEVDAPESRSGYDSWARSRFIIAKCNNDALMDEIEEMTKPAIFSGR